MRRRLTGLMVSIGVLSFALAVWWFGFRVSAEQRAIDARAEEILSEDGQATPSLGALDDDLEALGLDDSDERETEAFLDQLLDE